VISAVKFRSWLRGLGFGEHAGLGRNFTRNEVDAYVHAVDEAVVFTMVDFGVVDDALERIKSWQDFAARLCGEWGFSLTEGLKRVPLSDFRRIVGQDAKWKTIADARGWPAIFPQ